MRSAVLVLALCALGFSQTYPKFKVQQQFHGRPLSYQNTLSQPTTRRYQSAARSYSADSGQYSPDNEGQYDSKNQYQSIGQYSPASPYQNSGQYYQSGKYQKTGPYTNFGQYYNNRYDDGQYHDGRYYQDDSGRYYHDNSGAYVHQDVPYVHVDNPYVHQDAGYTHVEPKYVAPRPKYTGPGIPPAGGYGPPVQLRKGDASGLYDNRNYRIIKKIEDIGDEEYHYLYETENKIFGEEQGQLYNKGSKEEAIRAKGYFEYTGPDSNIYRVDYTADENGFLPDADHIPTPPPIPEAIQRSLDYKKSIGELKK